MTARCGPARAALLAAAVLALVAPPAHALRVVTWNLLAYDDAAVPVRRPHMLLVAPGLNPDVMIVQELLTAPAADSFANILKATHPGRVWKGGGSTFLLATQSALYYDSLAVSISNLSAVNTGGPRQVLVALVRPRGYLANAAAFRVYSVHFKAGDGSVPSDSATRSAECASLRNTLNTAPANTNILLGGDSNFYGSFEAGYARLTESQADNDGRLRDPLTLPPGAWNNSGNAPHHTQSPCAGAPCLGSSGGMDDRFDLILHSYSLADGAGLDVVAGGLPNGYGAYGNDGLHYNQSIDGGGFNTAVGLAVAAALRQASDHVPVVATLQLPAKLATASALDFGDVFTGAAVAEDLTVDNLPAPPAATLSYSLAAPTGFTAPGGGFTNPAASPPNVHSIEMNTAITGVKSGTITVSSNDLDTTAKAVLLSGRVLRHASPSLDSTTVVTAGALDFGTHEAGEFTPMSVRLHNHGYDALQSPLFVMTTTITGGDGHFSWGSTAIPALTGTGATYDVTFDPAGATVDSTYTAELAFTFLERDLPGQQPVAPITVSLSARRASGSVAVQDALPAALRFAPPAPNPARRDVTFAFDLPRAAPVSLALYDAGGRRVATLAAGEHPAGRHQVRWRAVGASGAPLRAGLYFARFSTPGLLRVARLALLP